MATPESSNLLRPFPHLPGAQKLNIEYALQRQVKVREKILESFPAEEAGLNVERIFDFLKSYNLRICPFIFIKDKTEFKKFISQYEQAEAFFSPDFQEDDWVAFYDPEIDLIIINADSSFEAQDALDKEWDLVHEQAHASCKYGGCIPLEGKNFRPRLGFSLGINKESNVGEFLEEGFAEWMASEYRRRYADQATLQKFDHFIEGNPDNLDVLIDLEAHQLSIPAKYLMFGEDGEIRASENAFAAYAFQLIMECRPNFLTTALQARSDPTMLAKIIREVNTISPGLYIKLRKLKYNEEDFQMGLEIVFSALEGNRIPS
jgi:hypothetical protein